MTVRTTRMLALLLTLAVALTACGGGADDAAPDTAVGGTPADSPASTPPLTATEATRAPEVAADFDGTIQGVLGGSDIEGGCVWLDADDGTRYELVRAPEADIAIDPQNRVIVSAAGQVIAREGDRVAVEGLTDPGLMTFCQVGTIFAVTDARAL